MDDWDGRGCRVRRVVSFSFDFEVEIVRSVERFVFSDGGTVVGTGFDA